jgi:hypothetical protein
MRRLGKTTIGASKRTAKSKADPADVWPQSAQTVEANPSAGTTPEGWTPSEEVELQHILACASGPEWQLYVREAQKNGQTLPLQRGIFQLRRTESTTVDKQENPPKGR